MRPDLIEKILIKKNIKIKKINVLQEKLKIPPINVRFIIFPTENQIIISFLEI